MAATFARARASRLARDTFELGELPRWVEHRGGDHVLRTRDGRVFEVDLVTQEARQVVGGWMVLPEEMRR